jgi:hypothetical protein
MIRYAELLRKHFTMIFPLIHVQNFNLKDKSHQLQLKGASGTVHLVVLHNLL